MSLRRISPFAPVLLSVILVALVAGCGGGAVDDDAVLAEIGDRQVTAEYFKTRLVRLQEDQLPRDADGQLVDMATLEGKRSFLDVIIDKELMVAKALQLGYEEDTEIQGALAGMTEYNAMIFFWQDVIGDPSKFVSDEDLDFYYSRLGERRKCVFLITDFEKQALEAREEALAGTPWTELVHKYHSGATKGDTDPYLTVAWGQYRDEFERPVFAAEEGGFTEPIPTEHGWWLLRIDEVTEGRKPDLDEIRGKVLMSIAQRNENLRREDFKRQIRAERNFMLDEDVLAVVFEGLPESEPLLDPQTQKPTPREALQPLKTDSRNYDRILMSYDTSDGRYEMTVADFKATFDNQNVFERAKRAEMLGGLRTKLINAAERSMMVNEARQRGYYEDERVIKESFAKIEEMLVEKVHQEIVDYEEYVSMEELDAFWADHSQEYATPELRSGHMVRCADLETAQAARGVILAGEEAWKNILRDYGNDPEVSKVHGRVAQLPATATGPLRDTLFAMQKDEISEPFETPGGWAVVRLESIDAAAQPDLDEVTETVARRIKSQRKDAALRALLDEWTQEFGVKVYEKRLAAMPSWQDAVQEALKAQMTVPGA